MAAAVRFAREQGLAPAVRGGGHSIARLSAVDGGLLIDLAPMDGVHVDAERRLAFVQGGALWGDVDRETQAFGLVAPGGVVSDTGVAGLTLGGGYGWVRRKYGLSVDPVRGAGGLRGRAGARRLRDVAPGPLLGHSRRGRQLRRRDVVHFALQPLGPTVGFSATFYAIEDIGQVLLGWRDYVGSASDDVTSVVATLTFPADPEMPETLHGRAVAIVGGVHAGDAEEGLRVMAPLRQLANPLFDMSGPTPFTAVQSGFAGSSREARCGRTGSRSTWTS